MRNRRWATLGFCVLLSAGGCGGDEGGKSYLIRHAAVTLTQATHVAESQVPGRAVKAELVSNGRQVMYQVEILDAMNQSRTVSVDAETGRVVN